MLFISGDQVNRLLKWPDIVEAIEAALVQIHQKTGVIPQRSFLDIPDKSATFICMPAYSPHENLITCKLLASFPENWTKFKKPTLDGCIVAFDGDDGTSLAMLDAVAVTSWRTAAGSIVAAKHLLPYGAEECSSKTLAVLGAGDQGRSHILGFQEIFNFGQVNLWNRGHQRAVDLAEELKEKNDISINVFESAKDCIQNADVIICTFAFTPEKFITLSDIPKCELFIFIGYPVNKDAFGIDESVYHAAKLYTEQLSNVQHEVKCLVDRENLAFEELGNTIEQKKKGGKGSKNLILYQSLGIALMDTVAVKLILNKYNNVALGELI